MFKQHILLHIFLIYLPLVNMMLRYVSHHEGDIIATVCNSDCRTMTSDPTRTEFPG